MARARNIKPGFFTNDVLAEVPPVGRLLFIGLWTIADREGRLEDRPRKIKAEVLPYDDCHIGELLDALAARGFIQRYEVDGNRYIQVLNFKKHQNPHMKEAGSTIPAPYSHDAVLVQEPEENGSSPADSGFPLTDPPNHNDASASQRKPSKSDPFEAFAALCDATGSDVSSISEPVKKKQLGKAKQLLEAGMTVVDIGRCAGYLASQDWRNSPIDMFTIEKERGKWELASKPAKETKRGGASDWRRADGVAPIP